MKKLIKIAPFITALALGMCPDQTGLVTQMELDKIIVESFENMPIRIGKSGDLSVDVFYAEETLRKICAQNNCSHIDTELHVQNSFQTTAKDVRDRVNLSLENHKRKSIIRIDSEKIIRQRLENIIK